MNYINENEDVLISIDKKIPDGFYKIPHFDSYTINQININNLFIIAKCVALAYKEFKESTLSYSYQKWLTKYGYKFETNYYSSNTLTKDYYKAYDLLALSYLYGGNNINVHINKPFIIPRSHIIDIHNKYDEDKIEAFIESKVKEGTLVDNRI